MNGSIREELDIGEVWRRNGLPSDGLGFRLGGNGIRFELIGESRNVRDVGDSPLGRSLTIVV